jgi:hypothetical protein
MHSAQCAMMCAAVWTRTRDATAQPSLACRWWVKGRVGKWRGRRTDSEWERQMICLLQYGGGCRFHIASLHTCTVHCTREGILCTSALKHITYRFSHQTLMIHTEIGKDTMWVETRRESHFVDKLLCARVASCYNSDRSRPCKQLRRSKSVIWKLLTFRDWQN